MYYVYVLRCRDGSLYTGLARYLCKRMHEHAEKLPACAKYTRSHPVEELVALWKTQTRADAARLEAYIKRLPREKKLALIASPERLSLSAEGESENVYTAVHGVCLGACLDGSFREED